VSFRSPAGRTAALDLWWVPGCDRVAVAGPMLRLGLDGGGEGEDGELGAGEEADTWLPERPGEADCGYYLRTGACGFGERCRYNHPRDRGGTEVSASRPEAFTLPDLIRVRVRAACCYRRIVPFRVDSQCG
jgi:hypothetical protein